MFIGGFYNIAQAEIFKDMLEKGYRDIMKQALSNESERICISAGVRQAEALADFVNSYVEIMKELQDEIDQMTAKALDEKESANA